MMLFDSVIYLVITWYVEAVFPGGLVLFVACVSIICKYHLVDILHRVM